MELYSKTYQQLDSNKERVMIAKLGRSFMANSKKITQVHISPITLEKHDGYSMALTSSGDRCIRLALSQPYALSQIKKIKLEVRSLAQSRLQETILPDCEESKAFREALEALSTIE